MACEETGIGNWQHKVLKNVIATQMSMTVLKMKKQLVSSLRMKSRESPK